MFEEFVAMEEDDQLRKQKSSDTMLERERAPHQFSIEG